MDPRTSAANLARRTSNLSPQQWAASLLNQLGIRQTPGAMRALVGWERAEGGHWNNQARFNPLNTTQPAPGAGNTGSQGNIKVYKSWDQGLKATVETLENGRYGNILQALKRGNPGAVGQAIAQSPWGTGGLAAKVIGGTPTPGPVDPVSLGGSQSRSASPGATATVQDNPQVALALQKLLSAPSDPAPQPASAPPPTANIAQTVLPQGYTPPPQAQVQPSPQSSAVDQLLQVAASIPPSQVKVSGGGGGSAPSSSASAPSRKGGVANFDGKPVAKWIAPILEQARKAGWKGTVNSGYRTVQEQARIYNSGVRPAAKPGQSNHNFTAFPGGAVDVSEAPQLAQILKRMGVKSLQWAGAKDPVHFSHPRNGTY